MRFKLALLILLLPALVSGQNKARLNSFLDTLIIELKDSWTLGIDSNSNIVDIAMYNKYKKLFDTSATITDDLNIKYLPGRDTGEYKIVPTTSDFDMYAHDVALQVTKLRVEHWREVSRNVDDPKSITLILQRQIHAEKPVRYIFGTGATAASQIIMLHSDDELEKKKGRVQSADTTLRKTRLETIIDAYADSVLKFDVLTTMRISLFYTADTAAPLKIARIENTVDALSWSNDIDADGVLNSVDKMPGVFGSFTTSGTPDSDLDAVPDSADKCQYTFGSINNSGCPTSYFTSAKQVDGFVGFQYNNVGIDLPELNNLGYKDETGADAMDILQSSRGNINKPGASMGLVAGGDFSLFFGKSGRRVGISVGVNYSTFTNSFDLNEPVVYTYKAFDGNDYYRRQINISSLKEEMVFNAINFPVQINYRVKPFSKKNWIVHIKAGPSFMMFSNTSDYNATVDFGGIYQVDTVSRNRFTYYPFLNPASSYNVYLTTGALNAQNGNPGAAGVFSQLQEKGYDFGSEKNYRDKQQMSRTAIACNLSLNGQFSSGQGSPIKGTWGFHLIYAPSTKPKEKYIPIEKTNDAFNSVYNGGGKSSYMAYGIHLGLVYQL